MAKVVYIGIFVSKEQLVELFPPMFEKVQCDHVTLAFSPSQEEVSFFTPLLGKEVDISVHEMVWDEKCQAVRAEVTVPCRNPVPHITISHRTDVKPVYSNELLGNNQSNRKPITAQIRGKLDFYPRTIL